MVRKALSLGRLWRAGDRGQALWPGSWAECSDKGQTDQGPDKTAGSSQLCERRGSTDWLLGPSPRLPCGPPQASPQRSALEPLSSSTVGGGVGRAVLSTWWPAGSPTLPGAPGLFQLGPHLLFLPSAPFRVACACCMAVTQRSAKSVGAPETVGPKGTLFPTFPAASRHQIEARGSSWPSGTLSFSSAGVLVGEGPYLT